MSQTPQNKKPPIPCSPPFDIDPIQRIHTQAQSILYMKYNTIYNNNDYIQTYYLIFNEKCRAVARFNDYLILDDNTEFLKRYYPFEEVLPKLKTIFAFYETYSKIFPNYMILQESECLYRNIRKKQKMIDAFNQIKKEEEENRERLKIGKKNNNSNSGCNSNNNNNIVFDKNVQNSINKCEPSVVNSKCRVRNEDSVNSISISLLSRKCMFNNGNGSNNGNNVFKTPGSSFVNEDNSFASIAVIIQGMDNNNNNNKNVVVPMETPKKKKKVNDKELLCEDNNNNNVIDDSLVSLNEFNNNVNGDHNSHHHIQSALNNNRKFISHKSTASVPEINNSIKIINNYHNIIIPQGTTNTVININAHIYPNDNNNNNIKSTTTTTVNNNTNNTQSPSTTTKGSSTASKQSNTLTHNNNNIYTHSNFQLSNPDTITTSNHIKSSSKIDTHKNITNMLTHSNNNNNNTNTNSKSLSKCKNSSMQKNNTNSYLNTQSSVHKSTITTEGNIVNGSCTIINNNKSLSKNKHHTHYTTTTTTNTKIDFAITKSAFKSPEKILSLSKKKNITTTVSTTNHIKPIYKNLSNIQTLSALQNTKVNPFKTKFERKKSIQKHNTSNSLNTNNINTNNKHKQQLTHTNNISSHHHEVINSFINQNSIFKKEIRTSLINVDTIGNNNNNDKQCIKNKHEYLSMRKYNGGIGVGSLRMFGVGFKHNHISTNSSNKLQQHSIEVNNYNCKGSNNNNNNNNNACSQRKAANLKTPVVKKVVMSPKNNNYVDKGNRTALTEKVKLTQKCPLNKDICVNGNPSKIIRSFNSKGVDANTTKMKFLRK